MSIVANLARLQLGRLWIINNKLYNNTYAKCTDIIIIAITKCGMHVYKGSRSSVYNK